MTRAIGVIGAGTMGAGVAHAFAAAGHPVTLVDTRADALRSARQRIGEQLRFSRLSRAHPRADDSPAVLDLISGTTDLSAVADASYIVENVTEDAPLKRRLFADLDAICAPDCVFAVNTSAIPITSLAAVTGRPDRVLGNHFMNPAHLMPLVEVIAGLRTSDQTLSVSRKLLEGIGKDCIVVRDSPGFVTNRVLMLMVNEAIFVLQEGISTAAEVDELFRRCFGHRMGPLETADLIGLDTILASLEVLQDQFGDPKYRPCPLLRRHVEAGLLGRKTGQGFHRYEELIRLDSGRNHGTEASP